MPIRIAVLPAVLLLAGCGIADKATLQWHASTCLEGGVDPEEIAAACSSVIQGAKDDKELLRSAYRERAKVSYALGRKVQALADHSKMIELDPNDAVAYRDRGALRAELGDISAAIKDLEASARLDPTDPVPWFNMGVARSKVDDREGALAFNDKALKVQADFMPAVANRCWLLAVLNRDLDQAGKACELALQRDPQDSNTYNTRGFLHYRLGEFEAAIADYDKSIAGDPKVGSSYYMRGMAKQALGRHDEAKADIAEGKKREASVAERYASLGVDVPPVP
ncbi:tetratricopeptide repeat protein [Arenimonas sp.]|uniref:tetratricopeptide repeat protein n=1 Tax=Arenimonas sp. TaxID=1872635 RepID=UPI0039E3A177